MQTLYRHLDSIFVKLGVVVKIRRGLKEFPNVHVEKSVWFAISEYDANCRVE